MDAVGIFLGIVIGLITGTIISYFILRLLLKNKRNEIIKKAEQEGEDIKKEKIFQAKEKFLELKEEYEKSIINKEKKINEAENRIKQKDLVLNRKIEDVNRQLQQNKILQTELEKKLEILKKKELETDALHAKQVEVLEKVSGMTKEEAKEKLIEALKAEAKTEAMAYIKATIEEAKLTANQEARKIVIQTIQRVATEEAIENAVTVFNLEDDAIKGRIIGREGRNIRAFEAATGVDLIIDDTPEAILLSCYDPIRREIARLSLQNLVADGRIHPARIEEVVEKTKKQIEEEIIETGKKTCIDLGIHGLDPQLMRMVGRMKYRSSYGQNLLRHSKEVANLCSIMASELGLNPKLAKRAGLLHDIGKVADNEPEKPHAIIGMELAEKYGERPEVVNAIGAHHDEIEMTSLISPIVQVCDAISGARPGARREVIETYMKRIKDLEDIALSYKGVVKAYAIQAGRELRVLVESEEVSDEEANSLSYDIAQKIQNEMTYPGQIKVTVIREKRAVNYAK